MAYILQGLLYKHINITYMKKIHYIFIVKSNVNLFKRYPKLKYGCS